MIIILLTLHLILILSMEAATQVKHQTLVPVYFSCGLIDRTIWIAARRIFRQANFKSIFLSTTMPDEKLFDAYPLYLVVLQDFEHYRLQFETVKGEIILDEPCTDAVTYRLSWEGTFWDTRIEGDQCEKYKFTVEGSYLKVFNRRRPSRRPSKRSSRDEESSDRRAQLHRWRLYEITLYITEIERK